MSNDIAGCPSMFHVQDGPCTVIALLHETLQLQMQLTAGVQARDLLQPGPGHCVLIGMFNCAEVAVLAGVGGVPAAGGTLAGPGGGWGQAASQP